MGRPPPSIFGELKRRSVFRVGVAYLVSAWLILQIVATVAPMLSLPDTAQRPVLLVLLVGLPVAIVLAWVYELGPDGVQKDSGTEPEPGRAKILNLTIIGVLLVALILSLVTRPRSPPAT